MANLIDMILATDIGGSTRDGRTGNKSKRICYLILASMHDLRLFCNSCRTLAVIDCQTIWISYSAHFMYPSALRSEVAGFCFPSWSCLTLDARPSYLIRQPTSRESREWSLDTPSVSFILFFFFWVTDDVYWIKRRNLTDIFIPIDVKIGNWTYYFWNID